MWPEYWWNAHTHTHTHTIFSHCMCVGSCSSLLILHIPHIRYIQWHCLVCPVEPSYTEIHAWVGTSQDKYSERARFSILFSLSIGRKGKDPSFVCVCVCVQISWLCIQWHRWTLILTFLYVLITTKYPSCLYASVSGCSDVSWHCVCVCVGVWYLFLDLISILMLYHPSLTLSLSPLHTHTHTQM